MAELEVRLMSVYGPIVGGTQLSRALGYPTPEAFRQALVRDRVPVPVFTIPGRRGKFAHVIDIARWVHQLGAADTAETRPGDSAPS